MTFTSQLGIYRRRNPRETALWKLLWDHFDEFEKTYADHFQKKFGFYRPIVSHVVHKYQECGDLHKGFARIKCPDCQHEYLLAFSCRGRWFCPSCHNKKVVQFGHHLKETILYPVPHRQYVFSIPRIVRRFFLYDRKLLGKLSLCASKSLTIFFKMVLRRPCGIPGIVTAIQSFGDYARWHPHLHCLVADGLFVESGSFYVMPEVALRPLVELFRAEVLQMLKKEGLIDDTFIEMILRWNHLSGFSVHNKVRIKPGDEKGIETLSQYIIRNTFCLSKLTYNEETSSVLYRSRMTHGKNRKNFKLFSSLEFIAAITQHIPDHNFQLVRYYGWYSNRMRGDRRKYRAAKVMEGTGGENPLIIDIRTCRERQVPSLLWRECIRKVWEVDPLVCPQCQGEMRIISFICKKSVISKILVHLGVHEKPKQRAPPQEVYAERIHLVPYDDGWPGAEELFAEVKTR